MIGNFVVINPHPVGFVPFVVTEIYREEVTISTGDMNMVAKCPVNEIYEIPLTEEWLVRFGFSEGDFGGKCFMYRSMTIYQQHDEFRLFAMHYTKGTLKYVHQLQNLYFAITGEVLTYNQ